MSDLIRNKRMNFEHEIVDKYEAGIELVGAEVKSVRGHQGSFEGAYVVARGGEAFLMNANIPPYQAKNTPDSYDPKRTRRLLLSKKEIGEIGSAEGQSGLTVVPVSMYNSGRKIKVQIAIVRGKKQYDKRESIKTREVNRDLAREYRDR